jgi:hypothetical protein
MHKLKMMDMKKITMIMFAAGVFFCMHAKAQFSRGTIMLGTTVGTTGYSSATSDYGYDVGTIKSTGTKTFTFSMGPQIGFFLNPQLVLGATPAFSISNSKVTSNTTNTDASTSGSTTNTTTTTVSLGPFMRYYLSGITGRNWVYVQVNGAVGTGWGTSSGTSYSENAHGNSNGQVGNIFTWNSGASLGVTHFFEKRTRPARPIS